MNRFQSDARTLDRGRQLLDSMQIIANRMAHASDDELYCFCDAEVHGERMDVQLCIRSRLDPKLDWSAIRLHLQPRDHGGVSRISRLEENGRLWLTNIPANDYFIESVTRSHYEIGQELWRVKPGRPAEERMAAARADSLLSGDTENNEEILTISDNEGLTCRVTRTETAVKFTITSDRLELQNRFVRFRLWQTDAENDPQNVIDREEKLQEFPGESIVYCHFSISIIDIPEKASFEFFVMKQKSMDN